MTGYEEFKVTTCSITTEECWSGDCSVCEVVKEKEQEEREQRKMNVLDFSSKRQNFYGVKVLAGNLTSTMLVIRVDEYEQMQANGLVGAKHAFGQYVKLQYPHFTCLMREMELPPPVYVTKADYQLGIFVCGDFVYICAPHQLYEFTN